MGPKALFTKSKLKIVKKYFKTVNQVIKHRNHLMNLESTYKKSSFKPSFKNVKWSSIPNMLRKTVPEKRRNNRKSTSAITTLYLCETHGPQVDSSLKT